RVARAEATEASARATEAADFLSGVLRTADPVQTDGQPITTREALDLSLDRIPEIASPKLRGQLLTTIGDIYGFMGEYDRADSLLTEAVRVLNTAAPGSEALYEAHHELGRVRWAMGDTEEAERRFRLVYDEAGAGTYVRTSAVLSIYGLYEALGRPDDALPWAQQFYAAVQEEGGGPGDVAYALGALGAALHGVGRSQEAAEMLEEALRVIEDAWGLDNQYAAQLHYSLSQAYLGAGDHEQAEAYALRMLDWRRSKVPPGSPRLYQHWAEVAEVYDAIGQSALAEAYADSFVTAAYTMFPDDGPRLALAHLTRSTIRDAAARPQAARADALAALRLAEAHGDSALVEAARAQTDRLGQSAE
ncbi:MAG: tetratricopeptide repeat protein, partial [Bacteroidota bacterium]